MNWILTSDGTYTLQNDTVAETYHSLSGAWSEARHVFIDPLLQYWDEKGWPSEPLTILDVGFGLGLNWLCLVSALRERRKKASVFSLESDEAVLALQYPLPSLDLHEDVITGFDALKIKRQATMSAIESTLILDDALKTLPRLFSEGFRCHAVLQDPFSPTKNPLCWSEDYFQFVAKLCHPGALVLTYSVAGAVRRGLEKAGFMVKKMPGFGAKREQMIAIK